jgi:hypothetical protein
MTSGPETRDASLPGRVGALAATLRQLGWLNGSLYVIDRVLAMASGGRARLYKYYLVAQPVAPTALLPQRRGAGLEVRQIGPSDPLLREFPRPEHAMPYRFSQGAICLAELQADKCIGFLWLVLGPYREDEVRCRYVPLPEGKSSWDFDIYIHPAHRNGIAFLKLWDAANRFLAERGIEWSLSRISGLNTASLLSHQRLGARRVAAATFVCFGSWQISFATVRPRFHWSTGADAFPTYLLRSPRNP